jgi:NAD(P)-dependent dehydrogenase (short-subunit alcohol dehydrogenase family)
MSMKLKGKVSVVTGAGAGIGESTALLFAREGSRVVCNSLSDSADKVVKKIRAKRGEAMSVKGDVSEANVAEEIITATIENYGQLDILVNNAGIVIPGTVESMSIDEWDRTMAVNVRSAYLMSRAAIPHLRKTKGTIVNTASAVALKGVRDRAAYSASKGALVSLTRAMAMDLMDDKIRVNCICPGTIDTPSLASRLSKYPDPAAAREQFVKRQPLGRFGTAQEVAEGILYLATSDFTTGTSLSIDGGMTV